MTSAAAYAPGHVTGFFQISDTASDPLSKGSLGAGFSIEAGVTTRVRLIEISPSDPLASPGSQLLRTQVSINGSRRTDAPVSHEVVKRFLARFQEAEKGNLPHQPVPRTSLLGVEHHVSVPESSGFGSSGSAALSLAYALNGLFGRPLSAIECGQIAHLAELACGTGLGTVIGEFHGGCEIRVSPGAPGTGRITTFDPHGATAAVFVVYGPLPTKSMLADQETRRRINAAGRRYLDLLQEEPTGERFLALSREFAEASGLISDNVREVLRLFDEDGIPASMLMFGDGVFSLVPRAMVPRIRRLVDSRTPNAEVLISAIEPNGGRMIDED